MSSRKLPHRIAVLCDLRDERGRILLIRRAKEPNLGLYSPIGGKLETSLGESPAQCARREIAEEAGVDVPIENLRLIGMVSESGYEGAGHWLMFIYRVTTPVQVEARTIREGSLEWIEPDALASLPTPETDRRVIWPLMNRRDCRFFAVHIACGDGEMTWRVEQEDLV